MKTKFTFYLQAAIALLLFQVGSVLDMQAQTYCNPYPAGWNNYIVNVTTTDGITNFTRASGDENYTNNTATHEVSQIAGLDVTVNVNTCPIGSCSYSYCRIYVDWNQDGDFDDADEMVYSFEPAPTTSGSTTFSATISVPSTAAIGATRMRVYTDWAEAPMYGFVEIAPCASTDWGEVEDYSFLVIGGEGCEELGPVTAGSVASISTCPSVPFTIVGSGATVAAGLERVWQSRPVGSTTWTTIAGAAGGSYTSPGITVPTEYRLIITCLSSGSSDTTDLATATLSSFLDCYCTPTATASCTGGGRIDDVVTLGAVTNISNIGTNCTGTVGGYVDYSATHSMSQIQGVTTTINVKILGWASGVKVWIDYNQNGVFETSELATASPSTVAAGSTYSGTFVIPYTALTGETRMRVRSVEGSTSFEPCSSASWTEAEDYTVIIIPATPCEELELVAGTVSGLSICPSNTFTIVNSGTSLGFGFERHWQSRPVGSTTWTTIAGAVDVNYVSTAGVTVDTEYRCIVTCPTTGESDTTNIATVTMNPFLDCYCTPTFTSSCTGGARINDVSTDDALVNISNLGTGCTGAVGSYSDFTSMSASHIQGAEFEITVGIQSFSAGVKVWIDWNQNGVYEDSELATASSTTIAGGSSHTGTIIVPTTATLGETRMRVRAVESTTTFGPCTVHSWGETEDYAFNVQPMPVCSDPELTFPTVVEVKSSPAAICVSGDVTLDLETELPIASGLTYQWQMSTTSATGTFTNVGTLSESSSYTHTGISADRWFRLIIYCEGTAIITSEVYHVMAVNPVDPTLFSGQTCGPGPVTLTGTVSSGFIYWYDAPTGGSPIEVGTSFTTPILTTDRTYYASAGASGAIDTFVGTSPALTGSSVASPFYYGWGGYKHQYLILASELSAIGINPGSAINSIAVKVVGTPSTTYNDFTVHVGTTTTTALGAGYITGLTEIFPATDYTPTTGINAFAIPTPIIWDGTSNIVVQTCFSNETWGGTSVNVEYSNTPFVSHRYTYADGMAYATLCGGSGGSTSTSSQRPLFFFNIPGCESERFPVEAYVRPVPTINISEADGTYCLFNNEFTLNSTPEAPAGHSLLWSNGSTESSIVVGPSAPNTKYWIEITNEFDCKASDTVTVTLNPSPVVELGPDVVICEDGTLNLDAGPDGTSYFWNTGANTREITVAEDGQYTVLVTNSFGCMATDTIDVTVDGYAPEISGITVENLGPNTFRFAAHLPLYIDTYEWDFGDETPVSHAHTPVHTYATPGTYLVKLRVTSSCATKEYVTYTNIFTSIDDELYNSFNVYPNPTNDYVNIEVNGPINMESVKVTNILGQNVLDETKLNNSKSVKVDVSRLPSGTYHINIATDKGNVTKTIQVVK